MKLLVESPHNAPMVDPTTMTHIFGHRPTVVPASAFINGLIEEDRLIKLDELADDADDDVFAGEHLLSPAEALANLPRPAPPAKPAKPTKAG